MLTVPEVQSTQFLPHSSPPTIETTTAAAAVPPTAGRKCDAQTCPWWPYSNSKDFKTNAALIVLILFCVVITVLSLNAAARYLIRRRRRRHHNHTNQTTGLEHKPDICSGENTVEEPPAVLFAAGMKLAGAEAECAICLSEFVEGEEIRVLEKCKHGFHVQCIRKWLNSRKSCPTCRSICYPPAGTSSGEVTGCISGSGAHGDLESGGREGAPQAPLV